MREVPEHLNQTTDFAIGAAIEVHRQLGPGFLEATYHRALEIELELRGVPYSSQSPVKLHYKADLSEKVESIYVLMDRLSLN